MCALCCSFSRSACLWNATVVLAWLSYVQTVILQVVVQDHLADAMIFHIAFNN